MSWFSKVTGMDAAKRKKEAQSIQTWGAGNDPGDQLAKATLFEQQGGGWQQAFQQSAGAYLSSAMPQLRKQLQMTKEDEIRRGISTGDLGTSYEGDVLSAFDRNASNTFGSLAMQGYENNRNRYMNLITGELDRQDSKNNQNSNMWASLGGNALQAAALMMGG